MTIPLHRRALMTVGVILGLTYAPQAATACKICQDIGSGVHCYFIPAPGGYMTCYESAGVCTQQNECGPHGPGNVLPEGTVGTAMTRTAGIRPSAPLVRSRPSSWGVRLVKDCRGFVKARDYGSRVAAHIRHSTRSIRV